MRQCHDYGLRTFTGRSAHRNKVLLSNRHLSRRLSHARCVRVVPIHLATVALRIPNAIQSLQKGDSRGFLVHNVEAKPMRNIPLLETGGHRSELVRCFASALDPQSRRRDF